VVKVVSKQNELILKQMKYLITGAKEG